MGDKVSEADKAPIAAAVEKLRKAAAGDDLNAIKTAAKELEAAAQAMTSAVQHGQHGGDEAAPPPAGKKKVGGDDVVDAEFEVK